MDDAARTGWPRRIGAITLFVEDLVATRDFYRAVFGLPIQFEDDDSAVFNFGNTLVNLLRVPAAAELVEPAPLGGPADGARMQLTIDVDDVDATADEVVRRGATLLNGPLNRPWGIRTAAFQDPAGHTWEIAGPIPK